MVGLSGFEPLTSRLSGGRSNQLSYRPEKPLVVRHRGKKEDDPRDLRVCAYFNTFHRERVPKKMKSKYP